MPTKKSKSILRSSYKTNKKNMLVLAAALVLVGIYVVFQTRASTNLIVNGDFAVDDTVIENTIGSITPTCVQSASVNNIYTWITTDFGKWCGSYTSNASAGVGASRTAVVTQDDAIWQSFPIVPGCYYKATASAKYKSKGIGGMQYFGIALYDDKNNLPYIYNGPDVPEVLNDYAYTYSERAISSTGTAWVTLKTSEIKALPTETAHTGYVYIDPSWDGNSAYYWDNVVVEHRC